MTTMDKPDRRAKIMQAAEGLFTARRFHEVTLDDVVRDAGVGKGTVYRYFKDKDDLFFQTAMHGSDELCELLERAGPGDRPFTEQLLGACERISAFFRRRRPLFRMMQSEESRMHWCKGELRTGWKAHRKRLAAGMAGILRRGVEERTVRGDVPAEVLASILLGMLRTHTRELTETLGEPRSLRMVVDLFLRGAGKSAPRQSAIKKPSPARTANRGGRT